MVVIVWLRFHGKKGWLRSKNEELSDATLHRKGPEEKPPRNPVTLHTRRGGTLWLVWSVGRKNRDSRTDNSLFSHHRISDCPRYQIFRSTPGAGLVSCCPEQGFVRHVLFRSGAKEGCCRNMPIPPMPGLEVGAIRRCGVRFTQGRQDATGFHKFRLSGCNCVPDRHKKARDAITFRTEGIRKPGNRNAPRPCKSRPYGRNKTRAGNIYTCS